MAKKLHLVHVKSAVADKAPSASTLNYGEIAVNYNSETPALYIRDDEDNIVKFISEPYFTKIVGTGITENDGETITPLTEVIEQDEITISAALNDLNDRKADKEYVDGAISGVTADIDDLSDEVNNLSSSLTNNYYTKDEVDDAIEEAMSGVTIDVDDHLDSASTNPVENRAIYDSLVFVPGDGDNSGVQKGGNLTVYGNSGLAEGASSTDAKERGLDGDSTNAEIIAEWESSSPEEDKFTFVKGEAAHAEGNNGLALGDHSHVEGNGSVAYDNSSHAEGTGTAAMGKYSHAEGLETKAIGSRSHSEGQETTAYTYESHSEGNKTYAGARGSHAEGFASETSKSGYTSNTLTAKAQPSDTSANWYNGASHAEGNATIAQGLGAHAEGEKTFANERATHAEGKGTVVKSEYSHAEGNATTAGTAHDTGTAAHSEGESTKAMAWASHAEGYQSEANGWTAHAEGANTLVGTGSQPTAYNADSDGYFAHAEGNGTWAKGSASHAEGRHTQALKKYGHAEGWGTTANGIAAHAEGEDTQANAECSHAEGWETRTNNDCEHAEGQYNVSNTGSTSDKKTMHSVGIGTSSQRKNAFEIMQNGDAYLYGLGNYNGTAITGDVQTLQDVIKNGGNKGAVATYALSSSDANSDIFIGPYETDANYSFVLENIGTPETYVGMITDGNEGGNAIDVKSNIPEQITYDRITCSDGKHYVRINFHGLVSYELSTHVSVADLNNEYVEILGSQTAITNYSSSESEYYLKTSCGGNIEIDDRLDSGSTNPVENRAIYEWIVEDELTVAAAINELNDRKADTAYVDDAISSVEIDVDSQLDSASTNPVENRAIYDVIVKNEKVVASALNNINDRKADLTYVDGALQKTEYFVNATVDQQDETIAYISEEEFQYIWDNKPIVITATVEGAGTTMSFSKGAEIRDSGQQILIYAAVFDNTIIALYIYENAPSSGGRRALSTSSFDIEEKEDKENKVSGITENNYYNTTLYTSVRAVYDEVHPQIQSTMPVEGFKPNVMYNLGTVTEAQTFILQQPTNMSIPNHYYWTFDTPSTMPAITLPTGITWVGGSAPTISPSKHYEISILNNIGVSMEV